MQNKDNRSKLGRYVPAFVFLIFIFGMAVWSFLCPIKEYSPSEKRYLKQSPDTSIQSIVEGKFDDEFETWFADQFPARDMWVGFNSYYNLFIGNNGANGVYNCKNGYLINKPVSTNNYIDKNLGVISKFKDSIDAPVTMMLAPSTGYIADDVLPAVHDKYIDDELFDKVSDTLSKNDISFVDLRKTFKDEYKNGTQLYYKTDHHWTTSGAYVAYTKLCEQLKITPVPKETFDIESYDNFYGTTYSTSGFWFTKPDKIEVWNNKANTEDNINVTITEGTESKSYNSMFFYDHLDDDDKYPVFIDGNHALTEITNKNAKGGTILLIKDSFSHCLAPFLAENYSKVVLVDMRYYKLNVSDLVKQENPDEVVVLYGIDNLATDTDIVWLR